MRTTGCLKTGVFPGYPCKDRLVEGFGRICCFGSLFAFLALGWWGFAGGFVALVCGGQGCTGEFHLIIRAPLLQKWQVRTCRNGRNNWTPGIGRVGQRSGFVQFEPAFGDLWQSRECLGHAQGDSVLSLHEKREVVDGEQAGDASRFRIVGDFDAKDDTSGLVRGDGTNAYGLFG